LHTSDTANKKLTSRDTVADKMATKKVEEYYILVRNKKIKLQFKNKEQSSTVA